MKAQVWSTDFIVSAVIFLSAFLLLMFSWSYVTIITQEQAATNDIESAVLEVTDILVRSPGLPKNWTVINVKSIGLAVKENELDDVKIENFLALDYGKSKDLLGIRNYDYYLEAYNLDNSTVKTQSGTDIIKGQYPADPAIVIPLERYALYNENIVKLKFVFWAG
ncbi:MAG: hypothetical protein ABIF08_02710 [Nanoarchaeota archaeon]